MNRSMPAPTQAVVKPMSTARLLAAALAFSLPASLVTAQTTTISSNSTNSTTIPNNVLIDVTAAGVTFTNAFTGTIEGNVTATGTNTATLINDGTIFNGISASLFQTTPFNITNRGVIGGSILLPTVASVGGDDSVTLDAAGRVFGNINTGAGNDTVTLTGVTNGSYSLSRLRNVEALVKDNTINDWFLSGEAVFNTVSVQGGSLTILGSFAGTTTVDSGATLRIDGDIVGDTTINGELLILGSQGQLNVDGNVLINSSGTLAIEADANGNAGRLAADGNVTLSGSPTLDVTEALSIYGPSTTYTIVTATAGVTGTFDSTINSDLPFLTPLLTYSANAVTLELQRNSNSFQNAASSDNQKGVSGALDLMAATAVGGSSQQQLTNAVTALPTAQDARVAFDTLSGDIHAAGTRIAGSNSRRFSRQLDRRVRILRDYAQGSAFAQPQLASAADTAFDLGVLSTATLAQPGAGGGRELGYYDGFRPGMWVEALSGTGDFDGESSASDIDYDTGGIMGGADFAIDSDWLVGFAVGLGMTDFEATDRSADGDTDSLYIGVYSGYVADRWTFRGSIDASFDSYETSRRVSVGTFNQNADAEYDGFTLGVGGEAAYDLQLDTDWFVLPFAGLRYVSATTDGFTEKNAGAANLVVDKQTLNSLYSTLGVNINRPFKVSDFILTPEGRAAFQYEWLDEDNDFNANFVNSPGSFTVLGGDPSQSSILLGLGVTADFESFLVQLDYNTIIASDQTDHQLSLALRIPW